MEELRAMTWITRHHETSKLAFFKRTISAQLHAIGLVAAIVGLFVLLHFVSKTGRSLDFWAALIFGITGIGVFAVSTSYHFMHDGFAISQKAEELMEKLDHTAIFLFIAGTYTPFLVNAIAPPWQTPLMILIWSLCILGLLYTQFKSAFPRWAQHRHFNTALFLLMGWTLLVRGSEAMTRIGTKGILLLGAGAVSYTVGALIYAFKRPRLFAGSFGYHELWHVMVMMGFTFHYLMILGFYR
jgi:hemolysin III